MFSVWGNLNKLLRLNLQCIIKVRRYSKWLTNRIFTEKFIELKKSHFFYYREQKDRKEYGVVLSFNTQPTTFSQKTVSPHQSSDSSVHSSHLPTQSQQQHHPFPPIWPVLSTTSFISPWNFRLPLYHSTGRSMYIVLAASQNMLYTRYCMISLQATGSRPKSISHFKLYIGQHALRPEFSPSICLYCLHSTFASLSVLPD